MVGGGANFVAKNRFKVYSNIIDKYLAKTPAFNISGSANIGTNNEVTVQLNVSKSSGVSTDKLSLHIALAEKSISYTGSNGINKHIFVVRDLFDGQDGQPLAVDSNTEDFSKSISLNKVVEGIKLYLDNPTTDESWRTGAFNGWRERTDKINPNNLAVVTWIQNNETKEILQSFYTDVTTNLGLK